MRFYKEIPGLHTFPCFVFFFFFCFFLNHMLFEREVYKAYMARQTKPHHYYLKKFLKNKRKKGGQNENSIHMHV